jgi:CRISPR-associated protein Cmr1
MRGVEPNFPPPEVRPADSAERVTHVMSYRVITPIFGGGVKPREADPISVVRVPGILGHLRFWWRVCRGAGFASVADLKRREDELWGSTSNRSQIVLAVRVTNKGTARPTHSIPDRGTFARPNEGVAPGYVSFPLQPKMEQGNWQGPWKVQTDVTFDLEVACPAADWPDLEAALWAWEHFGGVGARTRRGFGALACVVRDGINVPPVPAATLLAQLKQGIQKHVRAGGKGTPKGLSWLTATAVVVTTKQACDGMEAWKRLVNGYRDFRQARPGLGTNHPGRSYWPEPDMLRREDRTNSPGHEPVHPVHRYPRADLGLPIVFHFKDQKERDPKDVILQGRNHDRRASPLILRPHLCAEGAVGLGALLVPFGAPPGGYALNRIPGAQVNSRISDVPEPGRRTIKPLVKANNQIHSEVVLAVLDMIQGL